MKKIISGVILSLLVCLSLTGCSSGPSANLNKKDVNMTDMPEDYEFTKLVSYDSFSKYGAYSKVAEAFKSAKFDTYTIANGTQINTMAIIGVDKNGERVGKAKTVMDGFGAMNGMDGTSTTYVRGSRSYTDMSISIYMMVPTSSSSFSKKSGSFAAKYHQDIPITDEKGVGSFFGDNAAENPTFINPYFFIDTLKENGVIRDSDTTIYKASESGVDYYRITFGSAFFDPYGISECKFTLAISHSKIYGMALRITYSLPESPNIKNYFAVQMRPFTGTINDVPDEFSGYDMTIEEYMVALQNRIQQIAQS